jgi:hypothetical protein
MEVIGWKRKLQKLTPTNVISGIVLKLFHYIRQYHLLVARRKLSSANTHPMKIRVRIIFVRYSPEIIVSKFPITVFVENCFTSNTRIGITCVNEDLVEKINVVLTCRFMTVPRTVAVGNGGFRVFIGGIFVIVIKHSLNILVNMVLMII